MSSGKIVLGVLAGIAAGAVLGILFAPDKGTETRKKIAQKGSDTAEDLKKQLEELLNSLSEKVAAVREEASDLCENGKGKAENIKKEIKKEMN